MPMVCKFEACALISIFTDLKTVCEIMKIMIMIDVNFFALKYNWFLLFGNQTIFV